VLSACTAFGCRITRAGELLGIDLTDFTDQVNIYLALMIEG
jgi:DNA-binding PucR family transcriptional regulator